jgi:hypothetical protein
MFEVIPEKINSIPEFLSEYINLKKIYDEAQNEFFNTQKVNNDAYVDCIKRSKVMITFSDDLNQFQIQRHKEEIKHIILVQNYLLEQLVYIINDQSLQLTKKIHFILQLHMQKNVLMLNHFIKKQWNFTN